MPWHSAHDYLAIPKDFPRANFLEEVIVDYRMCQELVTHVVEQVKKEQLHSPLLATSDMVERHFTVAKQYGWGCSNGEMEWVFRNVVRELGCEMPASLLRGIHPETGTR